jgi:hypothetical protein
MAILPFNVFYDELFMQRRLPELTFSVKFPHHISSKYVKYFGIKIMRSDNERIKVAVG